MNKLKKNLFFRSFSSKIYNDLSSDLLVSISLSHQSEKLTNNSTLISFLKKNNILKNDEIEKSLLKHDRKYFLSQEFPINLEEIYALKPIKIGNGENMTDISMQVICLELLYPFLKEKQNLNSINIGDFGTGNGFMAFILYDLISNMEFKTGEIMGIDIYNDFIERNNILKNKNIFKNQKDNFKITFQTDNLENNYLNKIFQMINLGFAIPKTKLNSIMSIVDENNGILLAPVINENNNEQDLILFNKKGKLIEEKHILKCTFSEMKYDNLNQLNLQKNEKENKLKKWILTYKSQNNQKNPTLNEMQMNPEIKNLLSEINNINKKISRRKIQQK